ncbi:protein SFI1 homolog [Elysia marginata]|uniref:Protein SFI1 homolog n=1 Tax=Elysia marginata TaxID=1093978 RepID=A0AAV4H4I9_9GAST|nr:protein SFI1 homolog [Elysia marginata]
MSSLSNLSAEKADYDTARPRRNMQQGLLSELNDVLSIRAEKIRQRLVNDRNQEQDDVQASIGCGKTIDEEHLKELRSDMMTNATRNQSLIPVSKARLRRRQKAVHNPLIPKQEQVSMKAKKDSQNLDKTVSKGRNINIKSYKPGYTWNRGGRVKELRIRCIARKFLFLWRLKVFGRVPLSVARKHYEDTILQKTFASWYDYWWEIVKEWRLEIRAEYHSRFRLGLRMFLQWKAFVGGRRERNAKVAEAEKFYHQHAQMKAYKSWLIYHRVSLLKKAENKKALKLSTFSLVRWAWRKWQHQKEIAEVKRNNDMLALQFWSYRLQAEQSYAVADAHFYLRSMPVYLFHMKIFAHTERNCKDIAETGINFRRSSVFSRVFRLWHAAAERKRDERLMERMLVHDNKTQALLFEKAKDHHSTKVLKICVTEWKCLVSQKRRFASLADTKWKVCTERLSRQVLMAWHQAAVMMASDRRRDMAATVHHNRSLLQKVIQEWHRFAVIKSYRRAQTQQLLEDATEQLHQVKLKLYWQKWQEMKEVSLKNGHFMRQAEEHHGKLLLKKSIQAWKTYSSICLKKRLLARQSKWFHDVRLVAKFYLIWKDELAQAVQEQEKTDLALWQWSLVLQKKVLLAWQAYAQFRKHKKERMLAAASAYRDQLLRNACSQWLATADSLSHFRSRMAAQHQAKAVVDSFNLVHRIALHWKVWAKTKASTRRQQQRNQRGVADVGASAKGTTSFSYAYPPLVSTQRITGALPSAQLPITSQVYPKISELHDGNFQREQSERVKDLSIPHHSQPRPVPVSVSPAQSRGVYTGSSAFRDVRQRPPPKRPAFLAESLKRAGLFADSLDESSKEASQPETAVSERGSSPALSDLNIQEYPPTGRFQSEKTFFRDGSLSAEVVSGSVSSMGTVEGTVKPLHLHNSEDTDQSGAPTATGSSSTTHSPHAFTPSTQRSQFSGNPLLYSSPVSESNTARETWRSNVGSRPVPPGQGRGGDRAAGEGGFSGRKTSTNVRLEYDEENFPSALSGDTGVLLRGNLDGDGLGDARPGRRKQQQHQYGSYSDIEQAQTAAGPDPFVLLKPDYFMKKPVASSGGSEPKQQEERDYGGKESSKKSSLKHTPRNFASHVTDPTSGLPPMAEWKSFNTAESSSNTEHHREGLGSLRRTPREHALHGSPRRHGILHNKVSDSDGDASPLNTARSRGTVTFANPKSPTPEEELTNIRDRLKHFHNQKQKLRSLRKQYRQLSDWLLEQQSSQHQEEDDDSQNATEELNMLRLEVADLQSIVDSQRPVCERLVMRAKTLAQDIIGAS